MTYNEVVPFSIAHLQIFFYKHLKLKLSVKKKTHFITLLNDVTFAVTI